MESRESYSYQELAEDLEKLGSYRAVWDKLHINWPAMNAGVFYKIQREMIKEVLHKDEDENK